MSASPLPDLRCDLLATEPGRGIGEPARDRLLLAGLHLFAEQGYAKTSIRQIALAAKANVASVSYYFGNKAGLYRTIFFGEHSHAASPDAGAGTLTEMYRFILQPLASGELARAWIKLHRREMLEPTGLWEEKVDRGMQPMHDALVAWLCERLDLAAPDDDIEALAMVLIAPAVHLLVNCEVVDRLAPQLLAGDDVVDVWCARLLRNAEVQIAAERRRRRGAEPAPAKSAKAPRQAPAPKRAAIPHHRLLRSKA